VEFSPILAQEPGVVLAEFADLVDDCTPVEFFGRMIWHPTSSHFLPEIFDLKDAVPCEPLIPASVDTSTAISFLQHES
jgi:hypothetical protein